MENIFPSYEFYTCCEEPAWFTKLSVHNVLQSADFNACVWTVCVKSHD